MTESELVSVDAGSDENETIHFDMLTSLGS
jgi:hypothetical protein